MYRIRIFNEHGNCVQGAWASCEEAKQEQTRLNSVYAEHQEYRCTTVLERFEPTRPILEAVRDLREVLASLVGETDPILRRVQGLPENTHLLKAYDALAEAATALAQQVYDEEGHS